MSAGLETPAAAASQHQPEEFSYRAVPVVAPLTLVFGLLAALSFFSFNMLVFGLACVVCGVIAWVKIRGSGGMFGGGAVVKTGLAIGLLTSIGAGSMHAWQYAHEVPEGFDRVNFIKDVALKSIIRKNGVAEFHPDVKALEGKRIFIKGYMRPSNKTRGLDSFLLVKDTGECCFGNTILPTDTIAVTLKTPVDYIDQQLIAVAGTFRLGDARLFDAQRPIYHLEDVEFCEKSRTNFR